MSHQVIWVIRFPFCWAGSHDLTSAISHHLRLNPEGRFHAGEQFMVAPPTAAVVLTIARYTKGEVRHRDDPKNMGEPGSLWCEGTVSHKLLLRTLCPCHDIQAVICQISTRF
jgi:hypothetical protein